MELIRTGCPPIPSDENQKNVQVGMKKCNEHQKPSGTGGHATCICPSAVGPSGRHEKAQRATNSYFDGARCRRWTLQHRADTAALSHDRLPSDRSRPTRPGLSSPPACLRPAPQGPGERMRVRSTGAVAALGVAPRGAPRCCRPHQSVRSTLEPSPCRRAPLPTRTRSSAVACSGSSGCGGESQFEVSEWLVARVGICCTAAAGQR